MKLKNNKAGFSLVELMVVVAIIGVLATIAIPNFQRFQAKAKQSNAKAELSGIYTAQRAFQAEYSSFNAALNHIGFTPEGVDGAGVIQAGITRIYRTGMSPGSATCGAGTCGGFTLPAGAAIRSYACNVPGVATAGCAAINSADYVLGEINFQARSIGHPRDVGQADVWTIDQNKALTNTTVGI